MGGFGSGLRRNKKRRVEDCLTLTIVTESPGQIHLCCSCSKCLLWSTQAYWQDQTARGPSRYLREIPIYFAALVSSTWQVRQQAIELEATRVRSRGRRWWFKCRLVKNGETCNRRVAKLYLPPESRYFGCRHCYQLTYKSCQEEDKRVAALRTHPKAMREALASIHSDPSKFALGCKALGIWGQVYREILSKCQAFVAHRNKYVVTKR
jgi:hypothetical protein